MGMASLRRPFRPLVAITMSAMMTFAVFICAFAATDAQASYASYSVGDKFALMGEQDLDIGMYSKNKLLSFGNEERDWYRNAVIDNASLNGHLRSVIICEVLEVTDSEYVMKIVAAQNLTLDAELFATGELVEPGSYIEYWSDGWSENPDGRLNLSEANAAVAQFGFAAQIAFGAHETYLVHLQKSDMAVKSVDVDARAYARGHIDVKNYPETEYYYKNNTDIKNITAYRSFSSDLALDLSLSGDLKFDPYLTMLRDGPAVNSTWEVETLINGTFTWTGMLDITGLPAEAIDKMFDGNAAEHGVTGFPIDLAKIYGVGPFNNGTMELVGTDASFEFCNLGNQAISDPVYGNIDIYRLGFNNATEKNFFQLWYYPAKGYIVGMEMKYPMPISSVNLNIGMRSVPVADAEKSISGISGQIDGKQTYEQVNAASPQGPKDDGLMGLLPIIALVAIGAIAVVGIVFFMKRKKA